MKLPIGLLVALFCVFESSHSQDANSLIFTDTNNSPVPSFGSNISICPCVLPALCPNPPNSGIDIRIVNWGNCSAGLIRCCGSNPGSSNLTDGTCGIRKSQATSSIVGRAAYGAYPWQVALLSLDSAYIGSGVLITENYVLTVAHKIIPYVRNQVRDNRLTVRYRALFSKLRLRRRNNNAFKVRLGDWDVSSTAEQYPFQEYSVARIVYHPQYNPNNLLNDLAVIRLRGTVPLTTSPHINTACLRSETPPTGTRCWVSGWGKDSFGTGGTYQKIMKEVDVPLVNPVSCELQMRNTRLGPTFNLDRNSFLCAGGELGKDACTGDGGSPLVCQMSTGQWQVVGMVAWGIGCANTGVPGVYVNVANYRNWILQQLVL